MSSRHRSQNNILSVTSRFLICVGHTIYFPPVVGFSSEVQTIFIFYFKDRMFCESLEKEVFIQNLGREVNAAVRVTAKTS